MSIFSRKNSNFVFVILSLFVIAVAVALTFGNPASTEWPLKCPLFQLTGWQCPLCGMQRMVHELLHLNLSAAYAYNKVLLVTSPYWLLLLAGQFVPRWQSRGIIRQCYRNEVILVMFLVMIGWGIVRNI